MALAAAVRRKMQLGEKSIVIGIVICTCGWLVCHGSSRE
jgi:hypothetical protein